MADEDFSQIDGATTVADEEKPLLFDPVTRRYYREGDTPAPRITPPATQTVTAPPVPQVQRAPTPEQLEQQRDAWFAKVTPRAAMGDPRAKAAIVAADRAMVREYVAQGKSYMEALMLARTHSGLPITMAEEITARQLSPQTQQKPVGFTLGPGMTRYQQTGTNAPVKIAEGPPKPVTEKTVSIPELQRERSNREKRYVEEKDEKRKAELLSELVAIQQQINARTGIPTGTAVPEQVPHWYGKPTTNWVPGKASVPTTNAIPTTGAAKFRVLSIEPAP